MSDPVVKYPEPGPPIEVTVTIVAKAMLDPVDFDYKDRQPRAMMAQLESDLKSNYSKREWLVCKEEHIQDIKVDQS